MTEATNLRQALQALLILTITIWGHKLKKTRNLKYLDDILVGDKEVPNTLHDQTMRPRWQEVDALEPSERHRILSVVVSPVRDAKARQAYRISAWRGNTTCSHK